MAQPAINVDEARKMKSWGMDYRSIGIALAKKEGRRIPYQAMSIYRALRTAK